VKEGEQAHHSEVLKPKVTLVAKVMRVFASHTMTMFWYTIVAISIVAWLCSFCELRNWTRWKYVPLEIVMPALNGMLLYAMRKSSEATRRNARYIPHRFTCKFLVDLQIQSFSTAYIEKHYDLHGCSKSDQCHGQYCACNLHPTKYPMLRA
jgi:hypothetical protein